MRLCRQVSDTGTRQCSEFTASYGKEGKGEQNKTEQTHFQAVIDTSPVGIAVNQIA